MKEHTVLILVSQAGNLCQEAHVTQIYLYNKETDDEDDNSQIQCLDEPLRSCRHVDLNQPFHFNILTVNMKFFDRVKESDGRGRARFWWD